MPASLSLTWKSQLPCLSHDHGIFVAFAVEQRLCHARFYVQRYMQDFERKGLVTSN